MNGGPDDADPHDPERTVHRPATHSGGDRTESPPESVGGWDPPPPPVEDPAHTIPSDADAVPGGAEPDEPQPLDSERTVHKPTAESGGALAAPPPESVGSWDPPLTSPAEDPPPTALSDANAAPGRRGAVGGAEASPPGPGFAPRNSGAGIQVGDVLNHIFEVKRFIARGGMGEVFEGVNVNSEERVAIKVMLPQLAADPQVISMFRREARTLTRLQHEALVSYRVLAHEPQLGVLYIVTEYIEGVNLADMLGSLKPSPAEQAALLGRLASGLRAAHNLGAIHRDISPDNVLLENGELSKATIIDFGIAKDLDPGSVTIVGEGFAGKLSYVAPEQIGDYGREVGPWTDVYSLALVMLAVAGGRNIGFGGSLAEAVDKRRVGPDINIAPEQLRSLLGRMLKANPAERLRSMDEVLALLDKAGSGAQPTKKAGRALEAVSRWLGTLPKAALIGAGAAALLLVLLVVLLVLFSGGGPARNDMASAPTPAPGAVPIASADLVERARTAIGSALPQVRCGWPDIVDISGDTGQLTVKMTGVASSRSAAQADIQRALDSAGIRANLDLADVAQIEPAVCSALDTYRLIHAPEGGHMSVSQREFEVESRSDGEPDSQPIIQFAIDDPTLDFTVLGIQPSGEIEPLFDSRAAFQADTTQEHPAVTDHGGGRYTFGLRLGYIGWSGVLLITGTGPFDRRITAPALAARGAEWTSSFMSVATRQHWHAEMVWFNSIDRQPNVPPPAQSPSPANASAATVR